MQAVIATHEIYKLLCWTQLENLGKKVKVVLKMKVLAHFWPAYISVTLVLVLSKIWFLFFIFYQPFLNIKLFTFYFCEITEGLYFHIGWYNY